MTEITGINGAGLTPVSGLDSGLNASQKTGGANEFGNMLSDMIRNVESANKDADTAVQGLLTGEAQDLHSVMLAVHKADLSLRLALEVRNKLMDAYHEVMRMTV